MDRGLLLSLTAEPEALWPDEETQALLIRAADTALRCEGVAYRCEAALLLTDEEGIRALNRDWRGIDRVTDVLSFPAIDWKTGEPPGPEPGSDAVYLGDIAVCLPVCRAQALEYGHSVQRELSYLTVHSVLHLLGYDHIIESDKLIMRAREDAVMDALALLR